VFEIQAALWRAQGAAPLRVWQSHRWNPMSPLDDPAGGEPRLRMVMEQNAVRSDVLNLSNASKRPSTVELRLRGLPAEPIDLFEVPFVDTQVFEPVASALVPLKSAGGTYRVTIPAGMTRQVWFRCRSKNFEAGQHNGQVAITLAGSRNTVATVAVSAEVFPIRLPDRFSLQLGGWDYPDHRNYQVTDANVTPYVATLREYGVNVAWGSGAMPLGRYDGNGSLTSTPTRVEVDQWLAHWPNPSLYCNVAAFGSQHNPAKIVAWAQDWSRYLQSRGVPLEKMMFHIRDEPTTAEELEAILRFGRAVKQGEPRFRIFNNIHYANPNQAPPVLQQAMREACDVQCFNVRYFLGDPQAHTAFIEEYRRPGLEWSCYTGNDDRLTDPYVSRLLRPWFCYAKGMTSAHWFAFCDGLGGFSWNEYFNHGPSRTPLYLAEDSVTTSKFMEAMREGAQDYELLLLLRQELARRRGEPDEKVTRAQRILDAGVREVLSAHALAMWEWRTPKDRSTADRVRGRILRTLCELYNGPKIQTRR